MDERQIDEVKESMIEIWDQNDKFLSNEDNNGIGLFTGWFGMGNEVS